jgi:hypothetical protein
MVENLLLFFRNAVQQPHSNMISLTRDMHQPHERYLSTQIAPPVWLSERVLHLKLAIY